jgi:hypothetical protein
MLYRETILAGAQRLNNQLFTCLTALAGTERARQTHYLAGRFENIYIAATDIPEIDTVLDFCRQQAGSWLGMAPEQLKAGFWFNLMGPGQVTLPHHHDEDDELLSAVYYVRVPPHSGALVLHENGRQHTVQPQEGKLVLFAPHVLHEVTVNNSNEQRLSVAMNIGPA